MRGERDAFLAAQQRHHQYMVFGKKQRYIEVFQCSGDDMNHLLTGSGPMSAAAANHAASLAAAVASQAKNSNPGLLPPGMFPGFPGSLSAANIPPGMDPTMAAQLHQLQFLTSQNPLATLGNPFPPGFPQPQGLRPPGLPPGMANPFSPPGQIRPQFPGDPSAALWAAINPSVAGMAPPLLSLPVPTSLASGGLPSAQQQQQQAALFSQNFGLHNFLFQPNGQLRLPVSQAPGIVVSSAGGLSPQNAALLQSQLAAQRFLMQQQQQPMSLTHDPNSLNLPRPPQMQGLPPSYLSPISVSSPLSTVYTTTSTTLGSVSAPKRSFDQVFGAGGLPAGIPGKRVNYGYGLLATSPAPTISAAPTTYYAPTPNPS